MRVYLDNCCYNRPYDDQTQLRISLGFGESPARATDGIQTRLYKSLQTAQKGGFAHLPPRTVTNLVTKLLPLQLVSDALSNGKQFYFLLG